MLLSMEDPVLPRSLMSGVDHTQTTKSSHGYLHGDGELELFL